MLGRLSFSKLIPYWIVQYVAGFFAAAGTYCIYYGTYILFFGIIFRLFITWTVFFLLPFFLLAVKVCWFLVYVIHEIMTHVMCNNTSHVSFHESLIFQMQWLFSDAMNNFDGGIRHVIDHENATAGIFATYPQSFISIQSGVIDQVIAIIIDQVIAIINWPGNSYN